jgi:hypothetical protein
MACWVLAFKNGRDNVKDKCHTGHSVSAADQHHIASLQELLANNRCWSCQELARHVGIFASTVLHIFHDKLGMREIAAVLT